MDYDDFTDEELARAIESEMGLSRESALRAIRSDDPSLGRSWAVSFLEARRKHEQHLEKLDDARMKIRRAARA